MKKFTLSAIVIIFIGVGAGVWYLNSNLNSIVASMIEDSGSKATGTQVSVSGVELSLREGRGTIKDLEVASPGGYRADNLFTLGDITLDIDLSSVRQDPIVIDEIRILAPRIHAEFDETGHSNIDTLRKQVQENAGSGQGGESDTRKPVRLRIRQFTFAEGRVEVDASALGIEAKSLDLASIHMEDIGGSAGATPDEIASIILTQLARDVSSRIAKSEVNRLIEDKLGDSLGDEVKGLLDKITN